MSRDCIFLLMLFLYSCGNTKFKEEKPNLKLKLCYVTSNNYDLPFSKISHTFILDKKTTSEYIFFKYDPYPDTTKRNSSLELRIVFGHDSIILINGDTCIYEESKNYVIKEKNYKIKKYFFHLKNAIDDEGEFLINDTLGLVFANSVVWPSYLTYIHGWASYELNKLFDKDTSLFIRHKNNFKEYEIRLHNLIKR